MESHNAVFETEQMVQLVATSYFGEEGMFGWKPLQCFL